MRSLLDINVIIALLDADHAFHKRAHDWWRGQAKLGWASCPITENGLVRIMSNPNYTQNARFQPGDLISRLQLFAQETDHEFWPDDISLREASLFDRERLHSSRQLTDIYLLALATKRGGRLATFDQGIPLSAIPLARPENLCVV